MTEARRTTVRIVSNYARLFITVSLGLYLARVLLRTVGDTGFGLVALLGSTSGFPAIIEQIAGWTMIRELGAAHHAGDDPHFRNVFNSAVAVCGVAAAGVLLVYGIIVAALPLMAIPTDLLPAAKWFVIAHSFETATLVLFTPQLNMYLVSEHMVAHNVVVVARRSAVVVAAVSLFWLNPGGGLARGLVILGWVTSSLIILVIVSAAVIATYRDRRLIPRPVLASRSGVWAIIGISGWNLATQGTATLALPAGAILMNLAFGLDFGNMVFGLATRLSGYARMLASGMTIGLDAVAARVTSLDQPSMNRLIRYSTWLHGFVIFPAVVVVGALAEPLLHVWIGSTMNAPEHAIAAIATLTRILLIGYVGVCLFDCWTRILYGAGHVRLYAPFQIVGNMCILPLSLLFLAAFPDDSRFTAVACAFALVYSGFYVVVIPQRVAIASGMSVTQVLLPLARPLAAAIGCAPVLWVYLIAVQRWNIGWLILAGLSYGALYLWFMWFIMLKPEQRTRLSIAVKGRLRFVMSEGS